MTSNNTVFFAPFPVNEKRYLLVKDHLACRAANKQADQSTRNQQAEGLREGLFSHINVYELCIIFMSHSLHRKIGGDK